MNNKIDIDIISSKYKDELKGKVNSYKETPIVALITIKNYNEEFISNMKSICEYIGMSFLNVSFDENVSENKIIKRIKELNNDKYINGIIVNISDKYDYKRIIKSIDKYKNINGNDIYESFIILYIEEMLKHYEMSISSLNVCMCFDNKKIENIIYEKYNKLCNISKCYDKSKYYDIILCDKNDNYDGVIIDVNMNNSMVILMALNNVFESYKKQNGIIDMFDLGW